MKEYKFIQTLIMITILCFYVAWDRDSIIAYIFIFLYMIKLVKQLSETV